MVNNRDIDKLIVQKVFEMRQAGNSHTENGDYFHRSRRWAQNILHNYSKETFSPVSVKTRVLSVAQFDGVELTAARLFIRRHDMINQKLAPSRQNCAGMTD